MKNKKIFFIQFKNIKRFPGIWIVSFLRKSGTSFKNSGSSIGIVPVKDLERGSRKLRISSPTALLPILLLPLTEIYFRAFAVFPIEKRYGQITGSVVLVLLFSVTFVMPIILLAVFGAALLYYTNRQKSVVPAIVGQLVFYLALLFMLASFPAVRSWF